MTDDTVFTDDLRGRLAEPIDDKLRSIRDYDKVAFIKGNHVIDQLNRHFGFDGWGYDIIDIDKKGPVVVARVKLTVKGAPPRVDVGICNLYRDTPEAYNTAIKGAVTIGLKRAARTFGNQFGNSFYSDDEDAEDAGGERREPVQQNRQPARQPATRQATAQRPYGNIMGEGHEGMCAFEDNGQVCAAPTGTYTDRNTGEVKNYKYCREHGAEMKRRYEARNAPQAQAPAQAPDVVSPVGDVYEGGDPWSR